MNIEKSPHLLTDRNAVGLVCRPGRPEIERLAENVAHFFVRHGIEVSVDPGSCSVRERGITPVPIRDMSVDFVVTIGGDGTIIYTLQNLADRETPLFCINRGTVGFLTEASSTTALNSLERVIQGDCVIERCVNLSSGIDDIQFTDALNEVYIVSCIPGRLLAFQVYLDGVRVDYGRADGVMLATPCGSTAYALAAGGSILTPNVRAFIFVPVCPPRSELRPLVIPDDSLFEVEQVRAGACTIAVIDGQARFDVEYGHRIWLKKSNKVTRFIRMYDNYYDRLNTRLIARMY